MNSTALIRSTVLVIWLIVTMTLLSEVSEPFKAFLTSVGTHHWIGKSIISAGAFVLFYLLFRKAKESDHVLRGTLYVIGSVLVGGAVIFLFFLQNFIK
ncbi:MAG: hypothetical protein AAB449_03345 [Patescibacteria group bacterium]